ncbi:MAG: class I SAM-dependent DNA methyltransferase [Methanoregula sp.]|nr:class I SAM-dependent DNA methyltransferase [Methanoregula sp.]
MPEKKIIQNNKSTGQNNSMAKEISQAAPEKLSLSTLENWLFGAANILRGPVDQADYKTYIFPLLFFKRICDVYDEEYQVALEESDGKIEEALFRENYHFVIPKGCHWKDVRQQTENVGQALSGAMRCIEKENQETLYEIFGDAQWTNKQLFSDKLLIDLIEHFSEHNLANRNVEPDLAGQAYEYLIKKFADLSNKKAGEFYTPRPVIRLMTLILQPHDTETVYDPACGTGGMLLEAFNYVRIHGGDYRRLKLYGQEKNLTTSSIARMNVILHGLEDFKIIRGDTLRRPAFFEGDAISRFDCVIANPPFSLKNWGEDVWENDPYGRNFAGMPPASYGDYAWVQHMIASMAKPHGRMAIVLPQGALFRKGAEGKIRTKLLESDLLEAVIGLGQNLFYGTTLAACVCIFRLQKDKQHKGNVLFIDASGMFKKGKNQNELLPEHVDQIYSWYEACETQTGISRVATLDDIRSQDYNLNISLYVEPVIVEDTMTVAEALSDLKKAAADCETAEKRLKQLLSESGVL